MIIIKHILRNIISNKSKSILLIFAIFLSTLVLFLNLTINNDLMYKYNSMRKGIFKEYDLRLFKEEGTFSKDELNFSNIEEYEALYLMNAGAIYTNENKVTRLALLGTDLNQLIKSLITLDEELNDVNWDDKANVIIAEKLAKKYNFKLGDKVKLETSIGEIEVLIAGVGKNEGLMLSSEADSLVFVSEALCKEIGVNTYRQVYINLDNKAEIKDTVSILEKDNPLFKTNLFSNPDEIKEEAAMVSNILLIIFIVIVLLNLYVISSLVDRILAERLPVMGTFRSIGASKKYVGRILVSENLIYGMLGGILGIAVGSLLRSPISNLFSGVPLNYNQDKLPINISYIFIALAFAVISQVTISVFAINKNNKFEIKDIIFNTVEREVVFSRKKGILGLVIFNISIICYFVNYRYNIILSVMTFILMITGTMLMLPYIIKLLSTALAYLFGPKSKLAIKNLSNSRLVSSSILDYNIIIFNYCYLYGDIIFR